MIKRVGLDIAKNVFQLDGVDEHEKPQLSKRDTRPRSAWGAASIATIAAVVLVTAASPSWAQQGPTLGNEDHVLVVGPLAKINAKFFAAGLLEGLKSSGYADSRFRLDFKNALSGDDAKTVIGAAIGSGVKAIVTIYGQATQAAGAATTTIPIVFCPVADAATYGAPRDNLTGASSADAEASRRRLEAFRQLLPGLKRLAILFDPGFPPDKTQMKYLEQVAPSTGIKLVSRPVKDLGAAIAALQDLGPNDADAVFILKEAELRSAAPELKRAGMGQKLPILVSDPDLVILPFVLASVGPNQRELGKSCGQMTARILLGAKPADLPIAHPVFESLVNQSTEQRLGITVPEAALKQPTPATP